MYWKNCKCSNYLIRWYEDSVDEEMNVDDFFFGWWFRRCDDSGGTDHCDGSEGSDGPLWMVGAAY